MISAALAAGSVALAGFGLDSLIEIGACTIVVWQPKETGASRERRALRLIGTAFIALAIYIAAPAAYMLITASRRGQSTLGIAWTAVTCAVMLAPAAGKTRTGKALDNRFLQTEGRLALIDAYLAAAVAISTSRPAPATPKASSMTSRSSSAASTALPPSPPSATVSLEHSADRTKGPTFRPAVDKAPPIVLDRVCPEQADLPRI